MIGAGPEAAALAVYATAIHHAHRVRAASDAGFEGVACVDDAARAAILYCRIWKRRRLGWARDSARAMLAFVQYMQEPDGSFLNFVTDWEGEKNRTGRTSVAGATPWTARALHALATGFSCLEDFSLRRPFEAGHVERLIKLSQLSSAGPVQVQALDALLAVPVPLLRAEDRVNLWQGDL